MQSIKILLKKNFVSKTYIDKLDFEGILKLLENGFTLTQACKLLENDKNKIVFKNIDNRLMHGEKLADVFSDYCPLEYKEYFTSYIKFLPFYNSLSLSYLIYNESLKQKKFYIKKLLYPILIFIFTIIGIYLFVLICLPVLITLMQEFNSELEYIIYLEKISYIILNITFIIILFLLLVILFFFQKRNQVKGYKIFCKFKLSRVLKIIISNDFARFYEQCTLIGCSTQESIEILKTLSNKPLISFLANQLDMSLLKGNTIENAFKNKYLDKGLYRFLNISMYSRNNGKILEGYIKLNEIKLNNIFKLFSYFVQIFTYIIISIILIFVYQILMMPLSIISNL